MRPTLHVVLRDITPSRGTVVRYGRDIDDIDIDADTQRTFRWAGAAAPVIGDRAWHRTDGTAVSSVEP